ncbi:unnamed protein product [Calicophoron daubneyi]|uniref:FERM domain-containing protein n=1 Tax=Calicophoron daubneyi TaxID=300641 RepID=A0AAV2TTR8_CALDB
MVVKLHHVQVTTPESVLEFNLKHNSTGHVLLSQVCSTIGLREVWPFGLQYTDMKGTVKWVKLDRKIKPQSKSKDARLNFEFRVKFYPEEVSEELIQDITQRLFYYEVKKRIISGDIYCSADTALLLASYQAVVRYGKYDPDTHQRGYLKIANYIPDHILKQYNLTHEEWEAKISKWHEQHGEMSKLDAIMEYLKVAQDLDMYGVTYFPIKNSKDTNLWLGVDALGLNIYEFDDKLTPKISFPWNETRKLEYHGHKFIVRPTDKTSKELTFFCDSASTCKQILSLCTGNHELYITRRGPDTIELQQMKAQAKEAKNAREMERERLLAERRARELVEERYAKMEQALQEQEVAYELSQAALTDYQKKVKELEAQLEEERRAQLELQAMQQRLEEVNRKLTEQSAATEEERVRYAAEREKVMQEIQQQKQQLEAQKEEKKAIQEQLQQVLREKEEETKRLNKEKHDSAEQELTTCEGLIQPENTRQAMTATDLDYAKRLEMMKRDLEAARDRRKLHQVDIRYEENVNRGMDKYRTLHAIRQGNTKMRVEQFESM